MDIRSIGKHLRKKRIEKSWSQEKLADVTNLSTAYIGMIERGEKIPRLETFIIIINSLGVSADEVLMDVMDNGYIIRASKYAERIGMLSESERKRLYRIMDAFLEK